jgi:hypothetical protein
MEQYGYVSVFDVVREGRAQVAAQLGTERGISKAQADLFFDQAQARAASLTRLYSQLGARGEPVMRHLGKLEVAYDAAWMARALGTGANYEDWFKPPDGTQYAHPDSIGSLFSPGSYLTTLYRVAKTLHPPTSGLQLDARRPDLKALKLTDTHLKQELSTLELTLEALEAGVDAAFTDDKSTDTRLHEAIYPMTLPYNHAFEQIRQGLAIKKTSIAQLWATLGDHQGAALVRASDLTAWKSKLNAAVVQDVLGVNPQLYTMLTESYVGYIRAGEYLGFNNTGEIQDEGKLRQALKLPDEQILEALGTGPYFEDGIAYLASHNKLAVEEVESGTYTVEPDGLTLDVSTPIAPGEAKATSIGAEERPDTKKLQLRFQSSVTVGGNEDYQNYRWWSLPMLRLASDSVELERSTPASHPQGREIVVLTDIAGATVPPQGTRIELKVGIGDSVEVTDSGTLIVHRSPGATHTAIAEGLVIEPSPQGVLQLRFRSTVQTNGQNIDGYTWSLVTHSIEGDGGLVAASRATAAPHTTEMALSLGWSDADIPSTGRAFDLRLSWPGGTDTFRLHVYRELQRLVIPENYGARYLNGWVSSNPEADTHPFYWYIGPQVGHPTPRPQNNPANSLLYHRHGQPYDRLNRVVRLKQKLPLSFEELDWLISGSATAITDYPLTQTLQALSVYLPLRERFGLSVDAFVACIGPINTHHRPEVLSLFGERFGKLAAWLGQSVDFGVTPNPASLAIRAALCQGLRIDDGVLCLLAAYLPDMPAQGEPVLPELTLDHVAALFRLVEIPRLWGMSVLEGLSLWELLGAPSAIARALAQPRPTWQALDTIVRTGHLVDWMQEESLETLPLLLMTTRRYGLVATPELQRFIENIRSTLGETTPEGGGEALTALLCRHIGGELGLKANLAMAMVHWLDAVAGSMNDHLGDDYTVLSFWRDIQALPAPDVLTLRDLETPVRHIIYAHLLHQFAQVCQWAQLAEQDLALLLPPPGGISALTGETTAPTLTLPLLVQLSRYRHWQHQLIGPVAEARRYLARAATGELTNFEEAVKELAALHGWEPELTRQGLGRVDMPRHFVDLHKLVVRMQWSARLDLAPADLALIEEIAGATPTQADLELIAAKVMAAAHV